jgi:hypothetical protein
LFRLRRRSHVGGRRRPECGARSWPAGHPLPAARSPIKLAFGILFLVLCGFCLIPLPFRIAGAANVSEMVGMILPSLICAIIGLILLQKPKTKR